MKKLTCNGRLERFYRSSMKIFVDHDHICRARYDKPLLFILAGWLILLAQHTQAATLNVTNYGAVGDCRDVYVNVTSNSAVMVTTNIFKAGDIGKVVQLFGAGYFSSLTSTGQFLGNYGGTPTNHQDLVAFIVSLSKGTNVTLSSVCGNTTNGIRCTYGTQNLLAFSNCIAAAQSNDVIRIPAGNFQIVEPNALNTNYVQTGQYDAGFSLVLCKGGITFLGEGTNRSIITGSGAWQQKGFDQAYRGSLFKLLGPVTNNGPLIFNGIQFNGNATPTPRTYQGFPAVPTDAEGWDTTHHLLTDLSSPNPHIYIGFTNCLVTHWHGETIQGIPNGTNGFVDVGNCRFIDGYSTVLNYYLSHSYHNCWFEDYLEIEEGGQGAGTNTSYFVNNVCTNIHGVFSLGIGGADTNTFIPSYIITNNYFAKSISLNPGVNIVIADNYFNGGGVQLGGAGQQTTMWVSNVFIGFNIFTNIQVGVLIDGHGQGRSQNITIISNTASASEAFVEAAERAGSWSTNVVCRYNKDLGPFTTSALWSTWATGQYLIDDPSNDFPPKRDMDSGGNNRVGYDFGARHLLVPNSTNAVYYLDDSKPAQIPLMAVLLVTNTGPASVLYTSTNFVNPFTVTNGFSATFHWTNGIWATLPAPPSFLHVIH